MASTTSQEVVSLNCFAISTLRIHLFSDFLLSLDSTLVTTITIPRLQSLLAYLLLHCDAPQDRSYLAFLLWPDSTRGPGAY
jgi:DNA-binding SARP family transcriptional activator